MKTFLRTHARSTVLVIALAAVPAATAIASVSVTSLPTSTASDVGALTARENAVIAQLKAFPKNGRDAAVSDWEAGLKSAQAAQAKAMAKLDDDIAAGTKTTPTSSKSSGSRVGSVLTFQDENGNPYAVRLVKVIDPAHGANQFTEPTAGHRFVAAVFKITDDGQRQISDDANSNATLIGLNDQSYSFDVDQVVGCTNFNDGLYQIGPHQSLTGCVVFQLPSALRVSEIEWSPTGGFDSGFGQWKVS